MRFSPCCLLLPSSCTYKTNNDQQGTDLIHDPHSPVRIVQYFVKYGTGQGLDDCGSYGKGGVGTTLTGVVHFTSHAESHAGYCHGGSMCSVLDDVIGWCACLSTGECRSWSGFTVQINTSLKKPIRIGSILLVQAIIVRIEGRKVFAEATIVDPASEEDGVHVTGNGLFVFNRGVLPLLTQESRKRFSSTC